MLLETPVPRLICRIRSTGRANIRVSTACSGITRSAVQRGLLGRDGFVLNRDNVRMNSCPVCGASRLEVLSPSAALVVCRACSHVSALRSVELENRVFEGGGYRRWRQENQKLLRQRAEDRVDFLSSHLAGSKGRVFELGCGTGETLAALQSRGWSAFGADLSASSIEICRASYPGINVGVGVGPAALDQDARMPFDLVMGFHVAEHVPNLQALGVDLAQWCRPGGLLCLFVPNWESWTRRVFGDDWPGVMPEHVHQFTPASMHRWLSDAGFRIERFETASSAWHWLGGFKRKLSKNGARSAVEEKTAMPSRRAMLLLEATDILLRPLSWLENRHAAGPEMRVLARRIGG